MNRYNIRKIFLWPAFKFGAIIAAALLIIPGILAGLAVYSIVDALHTFFAAIGGLARVGGPDTSATVQRLQTLIDLGPLLVLWTLFLSVILGALISGLAAALAALIYNLVAAAGGGLQVAAQALSALPAPEQPASPPVQAPAAPVAPPVVQPAAPVAQPPPQQPAAQPAAPVAQPAPQQPAAPVARPAGPWLALEANPAQRWNLRPDRTRLGSAAGNDVMVAGLAAQHAEIRVENGMYILYDLTPGQTWVNGRAVASRNLLKEGFRIRLAGAELVFHAS